MTTSLTNLADCKAWLGVTSSTDDALLTTLIGDVSRAILADLGRAAVLPTTYVDTLDGGGARALTLRQWPVTQVTSCTIDGLPVSPSTSPGQPGYVLAAPTPRRQAPCSALCIGTEFSPAAPVMSQLPIAPATRSSANRPWCPASLHSP
jgi:hypothetical protein